MKSLSLLPGIFFWGMVLKYLSEAMDIDVSVTQAAVKWTGYGLWTLAVLLLMYRLCSTASSADEASQMKESGQ